MYERQLKIALAAAQEAAAIIRSSFHAGYRDETDKVAERLIRSALTKAFPDYGYTGEETHGTTCPKDKDRHLWLVDPHDGTGAAKKGYRGAAISIALLRGGCPVVGVIFSYCAPDDDGDLFWWAEGLEALHRNGTEVRRTWSAEPTAAGVVLTSQNADHNASANAELASPMRYHTVPGIAYRLALVAAGEGDLAVSVNSPTGWDVAGGHALLLGAGGDLFDAKGATVTYDEAGTPASSLSTCLGGYGPLVQRVVGRDWKKVLRSNGGGSAADSLTYLQPGMVVRDVGILSRAQGCLLGQFAGDALGSLVEFKDATSIIQQYGDGPRFMQDGGTWSTIAGQPTDDSELALSLARSIVSVGHYDEEAVAIAYAGWRDSHPFDIGNATSTALTAANRAVHRGEPAAPAARMAALTDTQANGALMRVSPLAIYGTELDAAQLMKLARTDAGLTHPNEVCRAANAVFVAAIAFAIKNGSGAQTTYDCALEVARSGNVPSPVLEVLSAAAEGRPLEFSRQQGWVLIALQNAFYQLLHAVDLEDGVVETVRSGGDTDTNAAIAGALLGAVYGRESIPRQWTQKVLTCRPISVLHGASRPRPACYWPVDALALAERLLLAGSTHP